MIHAHNPSRRDFLKQTGFLLVSFSMAGPASEAAQPGRRGGLPGSLGGNPDLDSWLRLDADGTVTVITGKMELGQGIRTALAQIAAEELDVTMARLRVVMADTAVTPNEGYTAGSTSIEQSGMAIRHAAAEARQVLLEMAAARLSVAPDRLEIKDGRISIQGGQGSTTFWDLLGGQRLERKATGKAPLKMPQDHQTVGKPIQRLEIPDIVTGRAVYVHDLRLPGMLYARILRPLSYSAKLESIPEAAVAAMPGVVKVVRDGSFVGVIANREEQAIWALERLRREAKWSEGESLPSFKELRQYLRSRASNRQVVRDVGKVDEAMEKAAVRVEASYSRPYHMHAPIGPACAVAEMRGDELTVWVHNQGPYPLRQSIANLLGMPAGKVRVIGGFGGGSYGHSSADDAAADAALLARALPGKPIRVQWSREDDHAWEPYGSAMMFDVRGGLDAAGKMVAWDYQLWSDVHSTRPGGDPAALLPARYRAQPRNLRRGGSVGGGTRNSEPIYELPNQRIVAHAFSGPLRVSAMRGLGSYANIFALESFIDELAAKGGIDPVELRLRHLKDERARAVIEASAKAIGWGRKLAPGQGIGIGFARYKNYATYCAVCAEVEVSRDGGAIHLRRLVAAVDSGQVINPDGLRNQIEGGMIQAASWTLKEQVVFDRRRITSTGWDRYPILSFPEAPQTEVIVLDRPGEPPVGAGEAAGGPTGAAIANAVFRATGQRVRDLPITPGKLSGSLPLTP